MTWQTESIGSGQTERLGLRLGARLRGGEIIELVSDVGGGKTTFVRGLAKGMGSKDHVASPTFTISRQYQAAKLTLFHFDFYRLNDPGIVAAELEEFVHDPQAVVAVEWADVIKNVLPPEHITLRIESIGEDVRRLVFTFGEKFAYVFEGEV